MSWGMWLEQQGCEGDEGRKEESGSTWGRRGLAVFTPGTGFKRPPQTKAPTLVEESETILGPAVVQQESDPCLGCWSPESL